MSAQQYVRAGDLRLPASRPSVDPYKLARQFGQFGNRLDGMPPLEVTRCAGGELSGVTRATRAYRYAGPEAVVPVVVIDDRPNFDPSGLPRVSEGN